MSLHFTKVILLAVIVMLTSCDITFKRKSSVAKNTPAEMSADIDNSKKMGDKKNVSPKKSIEHNDSKIITEYYSNPVNAKIREDMITHTSISKKQASKLKVNSIIQRDIQVIPLPLELERALSPLPLHAIRVQVGMHVILMNVKTRTILDLIKI